MSQENPEVPRLQPIGIIHSPFKHLEDINKERHRGKDGFAKVEGKLEIYPSFSAGLRDTEGFSHLIILFLFHRSKGGNLLAHPPFETQTRGVFATRSPHRPNPIGMSIVKLESREANILNVRGIDMLDGTPILDIKPYTLRDIHPEARFGWIEQNRARLQKYRE